MTIPKLAPYSMDAFRASSGNNEYTRLVSNKKCITIQFKDDICHSIYIRSVRSQLLFYSGTSKVSLLDTNSRYFFFLPGWFGLGQELRALCMLLCLNSPYNSFIWFSKVENRPKILLSSYIYCDLYAIKYYLFLIVEQLD